MMSSHRALPLVLGSLSLLTTSAILVIHVILVGHITEEKSPVRSTGILSAVLEAIALSVLAWLFSTYFIAIVPDRSKRFLGISFGVSVMVCTLATVSSVATMICLSNSSKVSTEELLGAPQMDFMIGSSVALGLSFACQLIFIVIHFVLARIPGHGVAHSLHTEEEGRRSAPVQQIKSIPYSQTSPSANRTRGSTSMDSRSPPPSSSGKSAVETIRTSISSVVRPLSSRRLLSGKDKKGPASLDSNAYRERERSSVDGFDSWDTSAVDPAHRQTVIQSTSPTPARFLETIPASPTTSRSPSPGCPLDLEPPRSRRRSRSYSPAGTRRPRAYTTNTSPTSAESHIHPLFRSDSPTPPPVATPGTVVMAAPNAGQLISDRQSIRSLSRMRSGSLPAVPSPLSRQGSFDDFSPRRPGTRDEPADSIHEAPEEESDAPSPTERKMTPPIPDWILTAGTRTSLTGYHSRRAKDSEGELEQPQPALI